MFAGARPVALPQLEAEPTAIDPFVDGFLGLPTPGLSTPPLFTDTTHHDLQDLPHQLSSAFDPLPPDTDPFSFLSCFALPRSLVNHPSA